MAYFNYSDLLYNNQLAAIDADRKEIIKKLKKKANRCFGKDVEIIKIKLPKKRKQAYFLERIEDEYYYFFLTQYGLKYFKSTELEGE